MGTDKSTGRRIVPLLGAVLLAQLVVGCSPAPKALLAVERTETGGTRLLMAPCPDFRFRSVTVFHDYDDGPQIKTWTVSRERMAGSFEQIDLFTPPKGFKVTEETLTSLENYGEYIAGVDGSVEGEGSLRGELHFSAKSSTNSKLAKSSPASKGTRSWTVRSS